MAGAKILHQPITPADAMDIAEHFEAFVGTGGGRQKALEQAERLAWLAERLGGLGEVVGWLRRLGAPKSPLTQEQREKLQGETLALMEQMEQLEKHQQ